MKTKVIAYALSLLNLFLAVSCGKDSVGSGQDGTGTVVVTLSGEPFSTVTRTAQEGNVMNTLSLWLVRNDEILIHKHLLTPGTESNDVEVNFAEDGKSATMKFTDIPRGNCTLYVVANYKDLDHGEYVEGAKIDDGFKNMLLSKTEIPDCGSPTFGEEGMPCSAAIDFSVSAGENQVSARLLRCVGRLTISVRNNIAESSMFFKSVGLSRQNPSLAYVFEHDKEIPAASNNLAFPELSEIKRVDALTQDPVVIYDTYLYETTPEDQAEPFTFSLFGAVYRDSYKTEDVELGDRQEYSFGSDLSSITVGDTFVLRSSASGNYYIGDNNGLTYRFFSGDTELKYHRGIENYFWKFSGTSNSTITNVATGRQIKLDGAEASMVADGDGSSFRLNSGSDWSGSTKLPGIRFSSGNYSLTIDPDLGLYGANNKNSAEETHWMARKVDVVESGAVPYFKDAEYEIPLVERPITYIDEYGVSRELRHIYRNEHVKLNIGVFYNRELGEFDFQVEPWERKDSETTFD